MKQQDINYFKEPRNWLHFIVGISFGYLLSLIFFTNRDKFPISWEYLNNAIYPFGTGFFVLVGALLWERQQDRIKANTSDMRDVWFSAVSGVIGGFLSMIYASWYIAIPLTVLSAYLVTKHYKK